VVYAGTVTIATLAGTATVNGSYAGGITVYTVSGSVTAWSAENVNLSLGEFDDTSLSVTILSGVSALNLTGYTMQLILKPSAGIVDTDPSVKVITGTVVTPTAGLCSFTVPHSDTQGTTLGFYRIDAIGPEDTRNTAAYGNIIYTTL
jgi:hypothetical protein